MWRAFAPTFGVAIQSTKEHLASAVKEPKLEIDVVKYGTNWADCTPDSYAFLKRRHFKGEQELRLYLPYSYKYSHGKVVRPQPLGRSVAADLNTLFDGIWVSPTSPKWFQSVVSRELKTHGLDRIRVRARGKSA
jgi:hypothetical protein